MFHISWHLLLHGRRDAVHIQPEKVDDIFAVFFRFRIMGRGGGGDGSGMRGTQFSSNMFGGGGGGFEHIFSSFGNGGGRNAFGSSGCGSGIVRKAATIERNLP